MTILGLHIFLQIPCEQVECIFKFVFVLYHMCKPIGSHSLLHCQVPCKATSPLLPRHVEFSEILKVVKVEVL
jgi:hypothetical protein